MRDGVKARALLYSSLVLTIFVLCYNLFQDRFVSAEDYLRRRFHYEQVISRKGLSLHTGMYWKRKNSEPAQAPAAEVREPGARQDVR